MAKDYATKIQILSAKHRDILLEVDAMFEKFLGLSQVQRMIERNYHEQISLSAISTYKQKHWRVWKDMIREQKAAMVAIAEIIGEDGLTAGVNALLWQSLQTLKPTQLMAFKKVLQDGEKVALMKRQFALYAQEHRQRMKERREAAKGKVEVVEDFEAAQRMVDQAKEIFGIGRAAIAPPVPKLLGPAEVLSPAGATDLQAIKWPKETPPVEDPAATGKESA